MPVKIITFGPVKDVLGDKDIYIDDVSDTDQLVQQLNRRYPELNNTPFIIAVDKEIISGNTVLCDDQIVALLPPYSGG